MGKCTHTYLFNYVVEFFALKIYCSWKYGFLFICVFSLQCLHAFQDLNNFESDPEEFAKTLCKDMNIEDPEVGVRISNLPSLIRNNNNDPIIIKKKIMHSMVLFHLYKDVFKVYSVSMKGTSLWKEGHYGRVRTELVTTPWHLSIIII